MAYKVPGDDMANKARRIKAGPLVAWLAGAAGLLLGIVLHRLVTNTAVADVMSAALSAAIAVLGAVLYAQISRREDQRDYSKTLMVAIVQLQVAAFQFKSPVPGARPEDPLPLAIVKVRLEHLQHRYEHLTLYRPYDRVGNFVATANVGDIDVVCRGIRKELEGLPAVEVARAEGLAGMMGLPRMQYGSAGQLADRIGEACKDALKSLTEAL